jgi:translation initiation factor 3 subunit M
MFFAKLCDQLSQPMTNQQHGTGIALTILSTMFNIIPPDQDARYHVFMAMLKVLKAANSFEALKSQLANLEQWLNTWEMDEEDQRTMYLAVADVAKEAGEKQEEYAYIIKALRTITSEESSGEEGRKLAITALRTALQAPAHFDFQDITGLDAIQALRNSDAEYFELLELFTSERLEELNDFKEEHEGWIEKEDLDEGALDRKMRLLTLASLAAGAGQTRELPYAQIAKALQITEEDVELWVIDVIRAGLVEGKLSQSNKTFLIHRSTYRVFGENQWREVAARLDMWKSSLSGVLRIVRQERENFKIEQERELKEAEQKAQGGRGFDGGRGGYGGRGRGPPQQRAGNQQREPREPIDPNAD